MPPDIGSYFEQLKRRATGGRRQDAGGTTTAPTPPAPAPSPTSGGKRSGGLADVLKDMLGKGRGAGAKAGDEVRGPTTASTTQLPPEGTVTVEYSPQRDGDPDPGEVVWTWIPYEEDPSQGKDRPVVIIGRRGDKLVGIPLTTRADDREAQIDLGTGDWDPQRRTSYARIWRMVDVDPDSTRREGAVLDRTRFDLLVAAVDQYYDIRYAANPSSSTDSYDY